MTSLNRGYFCENFISWLQGQLKFSRECISIALLSWTLLIVIIGLVRLLIIGGGQVFKWHRVMYCVILSVIIDATSFVLKMQSYLWIFFLKIRHILSGVSGIVFAHNVTDEIASGVFLSRLVGINRGSRRKNTQLDQWFIIYVKNLFALTNILVTLIEGKLIIELFL